jgi:hypothetical protein
MIVLGLLFLGLWMAVLIVLVVGFYYLFSLLVITLASRLLPLRGKRPLLHGIPDPLHRPGGGRAAA